MFIQLMRLLVAENCASNPRRCFEQIGAHGVREAEFAVVRAVVTLSVLPALMVVADRFCLETVVKNLDWNAGCFNAQVLHKLGTEH